ncbi:PLC-like phosphodiesterase [Rhodocollybia butyracea]|uniref:PLC-like phosphodiesterase n=1 Tax=Rhodocollybia butyracea TaxID=206335 RepID=A0A9P5P7Q2_9AGAR|nr:PLC-like phosphodiesterase [Rhodocollybia butyracea]
MRFPFFHRILALSALCGVFGGTLPTKRQQPTVCNGHAELCSRPYGNITFLGSHDSYAFSTDPLIVSRDQEVDIVSQLDLGVRMLQAEGHLNDDGVLHFCHTSTRVLIYLVWIDLLVFFYYSIGCLLFDGGTVEAYLTTVKTWLDANPDEVLTFLFTNGDGLSISETWAPAFVAAGIDTVSYIPPINPMTRSDWPTLGDLISADTRVITFMDAGADGTDGPPVDYILPEFTMLWEPPFDSTDASFPCSVNRTSGPLTNEQHLNLLNHNLDVSVLGILLPNLADAATTNGVASIIADSNGCTAFTGGLAANFVLLDWVDIGEGPQAVDQLNGFSS